jgi:post-segregation antitoxin (ccd killing protein)
MPTLSFHASPVVDREIRQEARKRGLPVSRVLKEVVERGLKKDTKSFGEWARRVAGMVSSGEGDLSLREGFDD